MSRNQHEPAGLAAAAREAAQYGDSFVKDLLDLVDASSSKWSVGSAPDDDPVWVYAEPDHARPPPEAGWKLHVSASLVSADDVLRRSAGILLRERARFKVAASLGVLAALNEGEAGLSQIGKFITVYPEDEQHAVELGLDLHEATMGLRGPPVLSDRPIAPGSLVHYRYGAFAPPNREGQHGAVTDAFAARAVYQAPEGLEDPFVAAGVTPPPASALVSGRYYISSTLHRSPRGAVYSAVDLKDVRDCIVKRAWRDARLTPDGSDARDQLRAEAAVLERLLGKGPFPAVLDLVEHETDLLLVMERIDGSPLASVVHRMFDAHRPPTPAKIAGWARRIARALQTIHEEGLVYRDLNPENVITRRDGSLSLIDFELAAQSGTTSEFYTAGTPGFISPQQADGAPAAPSDDLFALGAIMAFAATGARATGSGDVDRVIEQLTPRGAPDDVAVFVSIVQRCLAVDVKLRWPDARAVEAELAKISRS